ncbi:MAG: HEAT repeat domain-containing protein [Candidatus Eisenbacteria bacterium]|nr:HEAT repeat domain-containing protein [Candidatus Eisenbacteria bacterium]
MMGPKRWARWVAAILWIAIVASEAEARVSSGGPAETIRNTEREETRRDERERRVEILLARAGADEETAEERGKLYEKAQRALEGGEYERAAELFERLFREELDSARGAEALYWRAFALYREGSTRDLRYAREALELHAKQYDWAPTHGEAEALLARVRKELAVRGDARAVQALDEESEEAIGENRIKLATLEALLAMESEMAFPAIRKVLAERDSGSARLRKETLYLLARQEGEEAAEVMLDVVREDPDPDVREEAILWLGTMNSARAFDYLVDLLGSTEDPKILESAVFALARSGDARAWPALHERLRNRDAETAHRAYVTFVLASEGGDEQVRFLMDAYGEIDDPGLREEIVLAVVRSDVEEARAWTLGRIDDPEEPVEARQTALFMASERNWIESEELGALYDRYEDRGLKEQSLYALSRKEDAAALEQMARIAREETDPGLKSTAIYWIGKSSHENAESVLLELLEQ